jgi:DNA-binding GntR family transcriptional regulator
VIRIVRLRSASEQAIARLTNYIPADLFEVSSESLEQYGLYQLLRSAGVTLHAANQSIGARRASAEEARSLSEARGAALLTMRRVTFDIHGTAIEFGSHIYAASRYTFELALMAK